MSCLETLLLPHLPSSLLIHVALYRDLHNAGFLRQQLLSGNTEFEYAFIDASMVYSRRHALAAIFRAVNDYLNGRLKSRNVHSEIVFSFSPANNIADAFRKFGLTDLTKDLLVVKVGVSPEITREFVESHLARSIQGTLVPFDDETLSFTITDLSKIKKAYKLGSLPLLAQKGANEVNGTFTDERWRLEALLLGTIALRGA